MNPLTTIPPTARKVFYAVSAWLGLGLSATEVAYRTAHLGQPMWLTIALSVYAFLGTSVGATAITHLSTPTAPAEFVAPLAGLATDPAPAVPDYAAMSYRALQKAAKARGINAGGTKTEIVARLVAADKQSPRSA